MGAFGAEAVGRLAGKPVRWAWAGAIVLLLALSGLAPYRATAAFDKELAGAHPTSTTTSTTSEPPAESWAGPLAALLQTVNGARRELVGSVEGGISFARRQLPKSADHYLMILCLCTSALLAFGMIAVHVRIRRARRRWPTTILGGVRVQVAPDVGPAVIGLTRPDIVVPRWLLSREPEELQLVLAHEAEHLRSRDHILLAAACAAVVLVPWNPAAWWMLARLRLAVELDCDARVLRGGAMPRKYGALLIDLAEHCSGFRLGAATLADSSHLSQRLKAMRPDIPSFARIRGIAISALVFSSVLIACETSLPTSEEVSKLDASTAERAARRNRMLQESEGPPVFSIDGAVVTAAIARAVPSPRISSIQVVRSSGNRPQIRISTRKAADIAHSPDATPLSAALAESSLVVPPTEQDNTWQDHHVMDPKAKFPGLFLIDGVRVDRGAVDALEPGRVIGFEVDKPGSPAAKRYNDPLAANGVIAIRTQPIAIPRFHGER
jgi:hypothetical protein